MIFRTFQENAATLFLMLHQFLAMWIRSELYLIYFATEQSPIVKYVCATAIQSWSNLRNEWLHSKNWDQKVWASEFCECARMHANGTRMPLNGVQMHQKVSRRFQKFPEVSECIRITVVSAPNWPKIGRSVSKNKPPPWSLWELLTINAIYVRERLPSPLILSYTLNHLSPNACIATNIF